MSTSSSARRKSIRGMEAELVELVFHNLSQEQILDWLRVPLGCATAVGNLAVLKRMLATGLTIEKPP